MFLSTTFSAENHKIIRLCFGENMLMKDAVALRLQNICKERNIC